MSMQLGLHGMVKNYHVLTANVMERAAYHIQRGGGSSSSGENKNLTNFSRHYSVHLIKHPSFPFSIIEGAVRLEEQVCESFVTVTHPSHVYGGGDVIFLPSGFTSQSSLHHRSKSRKSREVG